MQAHWHLMDRESPWTVERQPFPTLQAIIHVKSVRAALGQPDAAVLFQTEPSQTCRWCAQQQRAEALSQQIAAVPERAPAGMLAVRVGGDPWTMVPLDNE